MKLGLPQWQCHKVVGASRIVHVEHDSPEVGQAAIITENGSFKVDAEWTHKHRPAPGGFFVEYEDGYVSYSPAQAFIEGYIQLAIVQQSAPKNFRDAVRMAINRFSLENGSDTPDFILAEYLVGCLEAFDAAQRARQKWYAPEPPALPTTPG